MAAVIDVLALSHACATAVNRKVYSELARRGFTVELVIPAALDGRPSDPTRADDVPLHRLPLLGTSPRAYTFGGLHALLRARRPRVVLLDNDPTSRLGLELGLWARTHRAKLVGLSCENQSQAWRASAARGGWRGLVGAVAKTALAAASRPNVDHVFVISQDGRRVQEEAGYAGRVTQIPVGFDPALFRPDPDARARVRERLGLTRVTVAYFGRIRREKGVHLLVEALAGLDADFQLLLDEFKLAADPYEQELARLVAASGLGPRLVRFDATHDEMPDYMNAADLVVVPSISTPRWVEQYGRVAPEAMACGRAVVVARSGALPELVGDAGVVVPEGDVAALRATLGALIADGPRRDALGAAGAARAHALLSVTRQVDLTEDLLRRLV